MADKDISAHMHDDQYESEYDEMEEFEVNDYADKMANCETEYADSVRYVSLPEEDETQIVDGETVEREVILYLKTKNGNVAGPECTPLLLPYRWNYETLRSCVEDYIVQKVGADKVVNKLYYKRANKKSLVSLDGDMDIPALLREYPLEQPKPKGRKKKCYIYLAVDLGNKESNTVRRSPRLQGQKHSDIFIHQYVNGKVSATADTLHNVSSNESLSDIILMILTLETENIYTPKKGLYWLRKGSRQPVALKNDEDLASCKREYGLKAPIKIACECLASPSSDLLSSNSRKRKLDMEGSSKTTENELWNEVHVSLVRDLEKKGVMWRYNINHLKHWTDTIVDGKSSGVGDEPEWDQCIEIVKVPPKNKRSTKSQSVSSDSLNASSESNESPNPKTTPSMMELFMLQNQQRMEIEAKKADMFQTTLLAMMSSNIRHQEPVVSPPLSSIKSTGKIAIEQLTEGNVTSFLQKIGLQDYCQTFKDNKVDGHLLEAIIHPTLGDGLMKSLGIHEEGDRMCLVREIYKVKFEGFEEVNTCC